MPADMPLAAQPPEKMLAVEQDQRTLQETMATKHEHKGKITPSERKRAERIRRRFTEIYHTVPQPGNKRIDPALRNFAKASKRRQHVAARPLL
jgi:hypothetical protein